MALDLPSAEVGVETLSEVSTQPRWVVLFGGLVIAALAAAVAFGPSEEPLPSPVPSMLRDRPSDAAPGQGAGDDVPATADSPAGAALDGKTLGFGEVALLADIGELASSFSLVEFSPRPNNNQLVRLVGLDGTERELPYEVYFRATAWPAWPGEPLRPFASVESSIVFSSRGGIVVSSLGADSDLSLGEGTSVIDGNNSNDFWVVESGGRQVSRNILGSEPGALPSRQEFPFADIGRPLAPVGDGLVVFPQKDWNMDGLALWTPGEPLRPIPVPDGFELLGTTEDLVITGDGATLVIYEPGTDSTTEVQLTEPLDMERSSLSPDGSRLALSQRHEVTSLGLVVIVDVETGATISTIDEVVDQETTWTSSDTVVTVDFAAPDFRVIEFHVVTGERTPVATIAYPWVYLAALS